MAVIREGIETALFLTGQVFAAPTEAGGELAIVVGAVLGLLTAAVLGWLIYVGARRINYGTFFRPPASCSCSSPPACVSHAIHELVEIGVITIGTQPLFDLSGVLPEDSGVGPVPARALRLQRRARADHRGRLLRLPRARADLLPAAGTGGQADRDADCVARERQNQRWLGPE